MCAAVYRTGAECVPDEVFAPDDVDSDRSEVGARPTRPSFIERQARQLRQHIDANGWQTHLKDDASMNARNRSTKS
jgi:hypothetical protein